MKHFKQDLKVFLTSGGGSVTFKRKVMAFLSPEVRLLFYYRLYSELYILGFKNISYFLYCRAKRIFASDIHPCCKIGAGFRLGHHMNIVIGPDAIIGKNVYIFNGVTLGKRYTNTKDGMPVIGDNVVIGTGAKLLGSIKIGNNVKIGANSVVLHSFPDNCNLVGAPANTIENKLK